MKYNLFEISKRFDYLKDDLRYEEKDGKVLSKHEIDNIIIDIIADEILSEVEDKVYRDEIKKILIDIFFLGQLSSI